jgi:hypothetical protein
VGSANMGSASMGSDGRNRQVPPASPAPAPPRFKYTMLVMALHGVIMMVRSFCSSQNWC